MYCLGRLKKNWVESRVQAAAQKKKKSAELLLLLAYNDIISPRSLEQFVSESSKTSDFLCCRVLWQRSPLLT